MIATGWRCRSSCRLTSGCMAKTVAIMPSQSSACRRTCNVVKARCLSTGFASAARRSRDSSCTLRCSLINSTLHQCVNKMRKNRFHSISRLVFEITLQPKVCRYYEIAVHCSRLLLQPMHSVQRPNLTESKCYRLPVVVSQAVCDMRHTAFITVN